MARKKRKKEEKDRETALKLEENRAKRARMLQTNLDLEEMEQINHHELDLLWAQTFIANGPFQVATCPYFEDAVRNTSILFLRRDHKPYHPPSSKRIGGTLLDDNTKPLAEREMHVDVMFNARRLGLEIGADGCSANPKRTPLIATVKTSHDKHVVADVVDTTGNTKTEEYA